MGERPNIPPEALAQVPQQIDEAGDQLTFLRRVGDFIDIEGNSYPTALDETDVVPKPGEPGKFNVFLHSRKGKIIIVTGASLLFAAGAGVKLQRNRSQRKKMTR